MSVVETIDQLGSWYHKINLGGGSVTPGKRNQEIVFNLYENHIQSDLTGATVLDLGANACGLSVEFAKRGASVVAVENSVTYTKQAEFVIHRLGLHDRIKIKRIDLFQTHSLGKFDFVAYLGLSYHIRHPQLALDMISHHCSGKLLASTQTIPGDKLTMMNRARHKQNRESGELYGWEPTENLFADMMAHAGFTNTQLVSRAPHPGEDENNIAGNAAYYIADAGSPVPLPFLSAGNMKPEVKYARKGLNQTS